jgi:hypothetical protein
MWRGQARALLPDAQSVAPVTWTDKCNLFEQRMCLGHLGTETTLLASTKGAFHKLKQE